MSEYRSDIMSPLSGECAGELPFALAVLDFLRALSDESDLYLTAEEARSILTTLRVAARYVDLVAGQERSERSGKG